MAVKLELNKLACRQDATRMLEGKDPTVSGLYRILDVEYLMAEEDQFNEDTTLRLVYLDGLFRYKTFGPLSGRSFFFCASDPLDFKNEKVFLVAGSDFLYTPLALF